MGALWCVVAFMKTQFRSLANVGFFGRYYSDDSSMNQHAIRIGADGVFEEDDYLVGQVRLLNTSQSTVNKEKSQRIPPR